LYEEAIKEYAAKKSKEKKYFIGGFVMKLMNKNIVLYFWIFHGYGISQPFQIFNLFRFLFSF